MHTWLLRSGDPTTLTLAADARLTSTDYLNDQIWELTIGRGEPPAINLQTTYGLRARSLRIFPRFGEGDESVSDPDAFASPIRLEHNYPSALQLIFTPLAEISAQMSYWIPQSHVAAGQITLTNTGNTPRQISLEWVALLAPGVFGERMTVREIDAVRVLAGATQTLCPVFFITGGMSPGSGSFPSLKLTIDLTPKEHSSFSWAIAGLNDIRDSFDLARQITSCNWSAEMARLELLDQGLIDIRTGEESWDFALARSQRIALSLISSPTAFLPKASFFITRQPDQGYSISGDGNDYNHLWNGQPALESYYLAELLLPTYPELISGVVENFITIQNQNGTIDGRPGLGGQRSHLNATPLLASLAWKVYEYTGDTHFLEKCLEPLTRFFESWLAPPRDRDNDRIPEWSHISQTGLDDHPLFTHWYYNAQGVDPTCIESPDLCAYLYREYISLQKIASILRQNEIINSLSDAADGLKAAVQTSWSESDFSYHYWDRDTHLTTSPAIHLALHWPEIPNLPIEFYRPLRLLIRVISADDTKRRLQVHLHGSGPGGGHLVEPLTENHFSWQQGHAQATSNRIFTSLDHLDIQGLETGDILEIQSINLTGLDITQLLPLWAGVSSLEQAAQLVQNTITNPKYFWRTFGLGSVKLPSNHAGDPSVSVSLPLNVLVAEGMLNYGYRTEAAELVTRLMHLISRNIAREGAFRNGYNADHGTGMGERNALTGLAPVNLFLLTLGIKILQQHELVLQGFNPYPWPVTVKYRGTTILCQKDKTTVIFSDGQTTTISDAGFHKITMDRTGTMKIS